MTTYKNKKLIYVTIFKLEVLPADLSSEELMDQIKQVKKKGHKNKFTFK